MFPQNHCPRSTCERVWASVSTSTVWMWFSSSSRSASQQEDMAFNWSMTLASTWIRSIFNVISYLCFILCCFSWVKFPWPFKHNCVLIYYPVRIRKSMLWFYMLKWLPTFLKNISLSFLTSITSDFIFTL